MTDMVESAAESKRCPSCNTKLRADARFCGNCGTKLPHVGEIDAPSLVGSTVAGAYRIEGVLGTGSMGVVYRAEQLALRREVALKVIGESSDDETTRARFRREARAASQLNHPNVVQVYDFGELPGGQPYLAMELLKGVTLEQLIESAFPIPIDRVTRIMLDVLAALQAAHNLGILHRDLKPANVFISDLADGREVAKVLDFGIATAMDGSLRGSQTWAPLTEAGFVCGTPAFMSPEQVQGFPLDQRSDLFSAAGLLYQMLTRERPFRGKSPVEVGANIVLKALVPPTKARPDLNIPPDLDALLERAMSKKPDDRFADAAEMIDALRSVLESLAPDDPDAVPDAAIGLVEPTAEWPETDTDEFEGADTVVNQRTQRKSSDGPADRTPSIRKRTALPVAGWLAESVDVGGADVSAQDPGPASVPARRSPPPLPPSDDEDVTGLADADDLDELDMPADSGDEPEESVSGPVGSRPPDTTSAAVGAHDSTSRDLAEVAPHNWVMWLMLALAFGLGVTVIVLIMGN